jgi:putative phosphoesterase
MKIGVLSDTHDRLPLIDAAIAEFRRIGVEAVIHPGDFVAPFAAKRLLQWPGPLHVCYGNNDGERKGLKAILPQLQDGPIHLELGGRNILVHHFVDWCTPPHLARADIVITGHTHEPVTETRDGRFYLNPGECCGWVADRCTIALLDTDGPTAEIIELKP